MNGRAFRAGLVLLALTAPAIVGLSPARAQNKIRGKQAKKEFVAVPVAENRWPDAQFDQWVFQQDRSAERARQRFESLLALQIDEIDRSCRLSAAQKQKLQLMGRGDIKRLFDGYERAKLRFNELNNDVQRLNEVVPDVTLIQTAIQSGVFQNDSLLAKSLRTTLTGEQRGQYDAAIRERREWRHRAQIELAVQVLEQAMPLRDQQRTALIQLLAAETKPPATAAGNYESYYVMYCLSRIPNEKFRPLLSPAQLKLMERITSQYKGYGPYLRRIGVLNEDD